MGHRGRPIEGCIGWLRRREGLMTVFHRLSRCLLVAALASVGFLVVDSTSAYANFCYETVNPAGNPAVGDNGVPNSLFNGDAVPGGSHTSPGTQGNGPINSDGFYVVFGLVFSDTTPIPVPAVLGGGSFWPVTTIKYTQWGNNSIKITSTIGGPNSAIEFHVQAPGDLYVNAARGDAGAIFCGVPPPPF
jgi:hypothetical protein